MIGRFKVFLFSLCGVFRRHFRSFRFITPRPGLFTTELTLAGWLQLTSRPSAWKAFLVV